MNIQPESVHAHIEPLGTFPLANRSGRVLLRPGQVMADLLEGPALLVIESGSLTAEQNGKFRSAAEWSLLVMLGRGGIRVSSAIGARLVWMELRSPAEPESFAGGDYVCNLEVFSAVAHLLLQGVTEVTTIFGYDLGIRVSSDNKDVGWRSLSPAVKYPAAGHHGATTHVAGELVYRPSNPALDPPIDERFDVVIIGAGPTGMSVAAHAQFHGLKYLLLGEPLSFWRRHMIPYPLRSPASTTNIDTPQPGFPYLEFAARYGLVDPSGRISLPAFIAYANWFAAQHELQICKLAVKSVRRDSDSWCVLTSRGVIRTNHVVVAIGLNGMQRIPDMALQTPQFYTPVSDIKCFDEFRGRRVAIIGGGQSAVEAAVGLALAGAKAHIVVRGSQIVYRSLHSPGAWLYKFLFQRADKIIIRLPTLLQTLLVRFLTKGTAEPALKSEIERLNIRVHTHSRVTSVPETEQAGVEIHSPGQEPIPVDHVVLGTGYAYDVRKIPFLRDVSIVHVNGLPVLNRFSESSAPGLYFCGIAALRLIGPQAQFVFGTKKISPRIVSGIMRSRRNKEHA